ncbi:MAG: enoyl-CoA hydratase [Rhodovibrionaceae bacterium]
MPLITKQIEGAVAVVTLNRPERMNALSREMALELLEMLHRLASDPEVAVLVLTGEGKGFCAGGDIKAMAELDHTNLELQAAGLRERCEIARLLHEMPKITIAMVNGAAAGAGLAMALACDLRIGAATAKLTTAFVRVGLSGDFGGSYFLTRLLGTAKARELYFTGQTLDAEEAYRLGLFNRLYSNADLRRETLTFAAQLAEGPRTAYTHMKRALNAAEDSSLAQVLDIESWGQCRCRQTADYEEAVQAFAEKRRPVFRGG